MRYECANLGGTKHQFHELGVFLVTDPEPATVNEEDYEWQTHRRGQLALDCLSSPR